MMPTPIGPRGTWAVSGSVHCDAHQLSVDKARGCRRRRGGGGGQRVGLVLPVSRTWLWSGGPVPPDRLWFWVTVSVCVCVCVCVRACVGGRVGRAVLWVRVE